MALTNDIVAAWTLVAVSPSVLFVAALFLRQATRPGTGPARSADRIVKWYAAHPQLALWVLMLLLPTSAFVLGSAALIRTWANNFELRYYTWRALIERPSSHGSAMRAAFDRSCISPPKKRTNQSSRNQSWS